MPDFRDHRRRGGAVLFDLDATLFDHRACSRAGLIALQARFECLRCWTIDELEKLYSEMLEEVHLRVLDRELTHMEARRLRMSRLLAEAGTGAGDPVAITDCYQGAYLGARAATPGAVALLEALRPRMMIGIVTNNALAEQRVKLEVCGLAPLIDELVASQDVGFAKPDPRIFLVALKRLGVRAEQAVMIGDSWEADVLGARAAGIEAIWFNPLGACCRDPGAAREVKSFTPAEGVLAMLLPDTERAGTAPLSHFRTQGMT